MTNPSPLSIPALLLLLAACASPHPEFRRSTAGAVDYSARGEQVVDFGALVPPDTVRRTPSAVRLERVSAGVPWPRGLALVDDKLVVLARGRHRRAGGIDPAVEDLCGSLLAVDPRVAEPVVPGAIAAPDIRANAEVMIAPSGPPFFLYDRITPPIEDSRMDRPYCTLVYDDVSQNFFLCGYSGVDLPGKKFRKNATDSIHRYDTRSGKWYPVEIHDASIVPVSELGYVVPNRFYPHHDPEQNPPPHGWLNGPDGCCAAGDHLYAVGKDNHSLVQYDLREIRRNPEAPPPNSRRLLGPRVVVRHPAGESEMEVLGPSAVRHHDGYLYVGYRTSSVILRFPTDAAGDLVQPAVGELIAVFEPWNAEKKRSANVIDIAFNSQGELFVSCAREARIWKVGFPDPAHPFFGDDQDDRPTTAPPYVDLPALTGTKAGCGNILFDAEDRLYLCGGNYDSGTNLAGAVYRAVEVSR